MAQLREERSLGDLFAELASETTTLLRQEVKLAKAEMTQSATEAGRGVAVLVAGGAVAYAGFLALLAAAVIGLWQAGLEPWVAALIVGAVVAVIGIILVLRAKESLSASNRAPRRTVRTIKEDTAWVKEQVA